MTGHIHLTLLGAIAAVTLVVSVSAESGTPQSQPQTGPRKKVKGGIRWALGLE
jgi:hypothetical protein